MTENIAPSSVLVSFFLYWEACCCSFAATFGDTLGDGSRAPSGEVLIHKCGSEEQVGEDSCLLFFSGV